MENWFYLFCIYSKPFKQSVCLSTILSIPLCILSIFIHVKNKQSIRIIHIRIFFHPPRLHPSLHPFIPFFIHSFIQTNKKQHTPKSQSTNRIQSRPSNRTTTKSKSRPSYRTALPFTVLPFPTMIIRRELSRSRVRVITAARDRKILRIAILRLHDVIKLFSSTRPLMHTLQLQARRERRHVVHASFPAQRAPNPLSQLLRAEEIRGNREVDNIK